MSYLWVSCCVLLFGSGGLDLLSEQGPSRYSWLKPSQVFLSPPILIRAVFHSQSAERVLPVSVCKLMSFAKCSGFRLGHF